MTLEDVSTLIGQLIAALPSEVSRTLSLEVDEGCLAISQVDADTPDIVVDVAGVALDAQGSASEGERLTYAIYSILDTVQDAMMEELRTEWPLLAGRSGFLPQTSVVDHCVWLVGYSQGSTWAWSVEVEVPC